ncbi:MAG: transcription elongation factor GreA, partial [Clostridia bacterium]|nr:transcription elongation factor GreA [Clostridia bacterium]
IFIYLRILKIMAKGKQTLYTQQGYQELVDELYRRTHEEREKIKNDIATARGFGDLSENAEYDAARNDQAKNEARIKELEELIENAVILDESNIDSSVISLGSTVKLLNKTINVEFTYALVGSNEANPAEGKISDQSPIGAALIGKKAGDEITVEVPNGTITMKVIEVSRK